jgi:hypothetical protein
MVEIINGAINFIAGAVFTFLEFLVMIGLGIGVMVIAWMLINL